MEEANEAEQVPPEWEAALGSVGTGTISKAFICSLTRLTFPVNMRIE